MKTLIKVLRVFFLTFLIHFSAAAAGMLGAFQPNFLDLYMDKEIRIERVDKKREDDETDKDQE